MLSYLDELAEDPDVIAMMKKSEWILVKSPGSSGWSEEFCNLKRIGPSERYSVNAEGYAQIKVTSSKSNPVLDIMPAGHGGNADPSAPVYYHYCKSHNILFGFYPRYPILDTHLDKVLEFITIHLDQFRDKEINASISAIIGL